ncbi:hypothetical protein RCS94_01315 [Orbaceae bacterium ac157xtp]
MAYKIFDICGTLYDTNTTFSFCENQSSVYRKWILKLSKTIFGKALNKVLVKCFSYDFIRNIHIKTLSNLTLIQLDNAADSFVENYLNKKKITDVHNILKSFDSNDIILVSATIEPIAKAIAKKLGCLKYIATTLMYDNGKCTGVIKDDLLGNKQDYFKDKTIDLVVTDNKSDVELCKLAKESIIVTNIKNLTFWQKQDITIIKVIMV